MKSDVIKFENNSQINLRFWSKTINFSKSLKLGDEITSKERLINSGYYYIYTEDRNFKNEDKLISILYLYTNLIQKNITAIRQYDVESTIWVTDFSRKQNKKPNISQEIVDILNDLKIGLFYENYLDNGKHFGVYITRFPI